MKQLFITTALFLLVSGSIAQPGNDLFFSEYLEGSSQNKALEIFNPTPDTISLDNYEIWRFSNGSSNPSNQLPIQLTEGPNIILPYSTIIISNGQIEPNTYGYVDTTLYEMADMTGPGVYPSSMYYNGNDAIALIKNGSTPVDLIGVIGQDPGEGWCDEDSLNYQAGVYYWLSWTSQNRLVRKPSVTGGVTENPDYFDPSVQWDSIGWDTANIDNNWSHLGSHNYEFYPNKATFEIIHEGVPVHGAQIDIYGQQLVTDSLGVDSIALTEGAYGFQIAKVGYQTFEDTLEMTANDTTLTIELNQAATYEVTFTVQNTSGNPVSGAQINIANEQVLTDSAGLATIELSDGIWSYEVVADEYQIFNGEVTVAGAPEDVAVELQPVLYELVVYVTYGDNPVDNAYVNIGDVTVSTDAAGFANIMLSNGTHNMEIGKDGYQIHYDSVVIQGENAFYDIELLQYHNLTFAVVSGATPVAGASIVLDTLQTTTDSSGMAVFQIVNGMYNYAITANNFEPNGGSVTVEYADTAVTVSLTGIDGVGIGWFDIYPNPTSSDVIIQADRTGMIEIFTVNGKKLKTQFINGSINYTFNNSGVYFIRMKTDSSVETKRVVVE